MTKTMMRVGLAVLLSTFAAWAQAEVTVVEPWVRGVVKGQTDTGAFMTLRSTEPVRLIAVSSPAAKLAQIHEMKMRGETMTMRPVKSIEIPAGKDVAFDTGGYHIMLIGLTKPIAKGDVVPIVLTLQSKAGAKETIEVHAEVRDLAPTDDASQVHNHHH